MIVRVGTWAEDEGQSEFGRIQYYPVGKRHEGLKHFDFNSHEEVLEFTEILAVQPHPTFLNLEGRIWSKP